MCFSKKTTVCFKKTNVCFTRQICCFAKANVCLQKADVCFTFERKKPARSPLLFVTFALAFAATKSNCVFYKKANVCFKKQMCIS